jgi:hypothetical protein
MDFPEFLKSLLYACVESVRRNKLPAALSAIVLVLSTALAFTSDFDERPQYRRRILPEIQKAEQQFFSVMKEAEHEPDDIWRLHFFLEGHRRAKTVLRVIREHHPMTPAGRKAQRELMRYYELIDEQLAIIRTELSLNRSLDYVNEWNRRNAELEPIRDRWVKWIN